MEKAKEIKLADEKNRNISISKPLIDSEQMIEEAMETGQKIRKHRQRAQKQYKKEQEAKQEVDEAAVEIEEFLQLLKEKDDPTKPRL